MKLGDADDYGSFEEAFELLGMDAADNLAYELPSLSHMNTKDEDDDSTGMGEDVFSRCLSGEDI